MSLIVLASDKGSPGVTTTAVALAGVWPRRAILAECDPSGGDLVYRLPSESGAPLNPNLGMLSLATTARHGLSAHQLEAHLQRMHGGLELITGLATGDQSAGLAGLWTVLGRAFDGVPDADVIADVGRVDAASPTLDLLASAALVVLVARTSAEQIAHVRDRALSLLQRVGGGTATAGGGLGVPIGVVLIVDPKQRARVTAQVDELLRTSGLPVKVIGTVADDPDGAELINGRGRGRLDRTLLIRSTREVALDLARVYCTPSQPTPAPNPMPAAGYAPAASPAQPAAAPRQPRPGRPTEPTVWPGEQPGGQHPPIPTSAHTGFTSVTLGGGPDPRTLPAPLPGPTPVRPQQHADQRPPRSDAPLPAPAPVHPQQHAGQRLPHGEIAPRPGSHRATPPSQPGIDSRGLDPRGVDPRDGAPARPPGQIPVQPIQPVQPVQPIQPEQPGTHRAVSPPQGGRP